MFTKVTAGLIPSFENLCNGIVLSKEFKVVNGLQKKNSYSICVFNILKTDASGPSSIIRIQPLRYTPNFTPNENLRGVD
jgi:hypothetical protein